MMRIKTFMISIVFLTLLFACEKDEKRTYRETEGGRCLRG